MSTPKKKYTYVITFGNGERLVADEVYDTKEEVEDEIAYDLECRSAGNNLMELMGDMEDFEDYSTFDYEIIEVEE